MNEEKILEILVQLRKTYNLLGEVMDLSMQMAEALDREDQISFKMLLPMRREPIQNLAHAKEIIMELLSEFPADDAAQIRKVLNGSKPQSVTLQQIAEQTASNGRLWEKVNRIDMQLNRKITHEQSVYHD